MSVFDREQHKTAISEALSEQSGVVLLGPRQVGKTTLARAIAESIPDAVYLDAERTADKKILAEPDLYLAEQMGRLVIIDEVQRLPGLFDSLRGQIDDRRRAGHDTGQFLLLGTAARILLRQSVESLAGRVRYYELTPFSIDEQGVESTETLWLRGGFPKSLLAGTDRISHRWRMDFIRDYLERDIPAFGVNIPIETMRRFWTMLAHNQGGILNAAQLAASIGISGSGVARYIDLLVDLMLVRRLPPWHGNTGKRLVKSPKVYIRDSGLTHALLNIRTLEELLGHYVVGHSWEGFCIEQLITAAPEGTVAGYYRTAGGAEIDLVLQLPGGAVWGIEIKRSTAPKISRGFHNAAVDLRLDRRILVYAGDREVPMPQGVRAMPLMEAVKKVKKTQI